MPRKKSAKKTLDTTTVKMPSGSTIVLPNIVIPPPSPTPTPKPVPTKNGFKVGDEVVVVSKNGRHTNSSAYSIGSIGKITQLGPSYENVVRLDDSSDGWVETEDIKIKVNIGLSSVILDNKKVEEIKSAMAQVENQKKIFDDWGFSEVFEKGTAISMLFWGIPGTGKTLMAQAVADSIGAKLKIIGTADIQSSEPGGAERTIRKIFAEANKANSSNKKVVLLFDECDSLLADRNSIGVILAAEVNALLSELEKYSGVIIFTTNRLGKLDAALERRITAKIEFEFPDKEARKKIWKRMIPHQAPIDKDVDFNHLAEFALVGGNIKNAVLNAARKAAYLKLQSINMECFLEGIEKELRGIQSFVAEYEKQDGTKLASELTRSTTGITVDRKKVREVKKEKEMVTDKGKSPLWED